MNLKTNIHRSEGVEYIDMFVPVTDGTQWLARSVWPDEYHLRPIVIAEMLRTIGRAVKEGKISVEALHV